ncbi:glucokinase family protein [Stenotrophomonas sp. YIM B06876]|uniref:glucokinase family protein n=1 Tax=Stenotrophomonas sp. YIM B06876 TaxID=3060211 RepID=UPI0027381829|nr:glucokinase family protein [Stenotrophomonas sp. YIM B06876]
MTATIPPQSAPASGAGDPPFLAADVGGTHVRIGLVQPGAGPTAPITLLAYRKYRCADYPSLGAILADFRQHLPSVRDCVIASAGCQLADGSVITANLPWPLSPAQLRDALGFDAVHLVNDFEAVAHAAAQVDASQVLQLTGPPTAPRGPTLVVGPGTGLGAAVWIPLGGRSVVLATEAGQAALATGTDLEMAVLRRLLQGRSHVPTEQALSGPGLLNLYTALCAVRGQRPQHARPDAVSAAARAGSDPLAVETLQLFCGLLGSTVGDMALLYGIQGGIYLAGGILPRISELLLHSSFVERFLNKGPMRKALERIPVKLVEHGQLGVIGAARWYMEKTAPPGPGTTGAASR